MNAGTFSAMLRNHGIDVAIGLFAIGAVLGSSAWIVGAGVVAGANMTARLARGELMSVPDRPDLDRRVH